MKLHILGTGGPLPETSRYGSAAILQVGDDNLLIDCGPAATYKMIRVGIHPTDIDWLFFTHHHFDHNADYPCFLLTRWDSGNGSEGRLSVFGPPPTRELTDRLIGEEGAFSADWKARVGHPVSQHKHQSRGGSLPRPAPSFDVADVDAGSVVETAHWRVRAERVHHVDPWLVSLGYRIDSDRGSCVFIGDAGPCEEIGRLAAGADVLVIGCAYHTGREVDPRVADVSTGSLDVARIASEAGNRAVVVTHMSTRLARPGVRERVIADIAGIYDGTIVFADELMTVDLP